MNVWIKSFFRMLFPSYCMVCKRRLALGEEYICCVCHINMPRAKLGLQELDRTEQTLMSIRGFVRAESLMHYYKESRYKSLILHSKYFNRPDTGTWLARLAAPDLVAGGFFKTIDCMVPVPLSRRKMKKRGYNQCDYIAEGLHEATGIPVLHDAVARTAHNAMQAGQGRLSRWKNADGIFAVLKPGELQGKHILLVDDVVTTGATILSLAGVIQSSARNVRFSLFTLAYAE